MDLLNEEELDNEFFLVFTINRIRLFITINIRTSSGIFNT